MENKEIAPQEAPFGKKIRVKVYLNPVQFQELADDATKAGFRRVGLQLFTQKPGGFGFEKVSNTDGMSKFLKECWGFWKKNREEYDRLKTKERLRQELDKLEK